MSYDIRLDGVEFRHPHREAGGTYALGGTTEAWFNITYNYSKHFRRVLGEKGIRTIYGMTAEASIPILEAAIDKLDTDVDPDYWKSTEGNARVALSSLRSIAKQACDEGFDLAIWAGD